MIFVFKLSGAANMDQHELRKKQMAAAQAEAYEVFCRKNRDYGDAFATHGPLGVIVRMHDKLNRVINVTNSGIMMVETEAVRDTLIDLMNYSAMAVMLIDENAETKNALSGGLK